MKELKYICAFEEWKDIPNFEGYQVSTFGNVKSLDRFRKGKFGMRLIKGQLLKQVLNKKGYPEVRFYKDRSHTRLVHKIVASAFMIKPKHCTQINHKNGVKTDNRLENLEWVTQSKNQLHAYKLGLQPSRAGENNNNTTLKNEEVTNLKEFYNSGKTIKEISKITGISIQIIRNIMYGRTWKTNSVKLLKRDDRSNKSIESIEKIIRTKQSKGILGVAIVQLSKDGKKLNSFRSINYASAKTGIPRKSIEAVVHNKEFYSKDKSKSWKMTEAGGFVWKKL